MEYASNSKGNLGVALGAIGTGLSAINGGFGVGNWFGGMNDGRCGDHYVTQAELHYAQGIAARDAEIAMLRSEQNTEVKIADVYERLITRINADQRAQAEVNAAQAVYNATANSAIAVLQNQVGVLNSLTKTVIPIENICPEAMRRYNSWVPPIEE